MTTPVVGLILVGGKSRRMGRDKGKLVYRGISQRMYAYALLEATCGKAFFSCNSSQEEELSTFPYIVDNYPGQGPLGGILSAFERYPETSFLVMACDMPNIDLPSLQALLEKRASEREATVLQHPESGQIEPMFAIWESSCLDKLKTYWDQGGRKLTDFLSILDRETVLLKNPEVLQNINTLQEYQAYKLKWTEGKYHSAHYTPV